MAMQLFEGMDFSGQPISSLFFKTPPSLASIFAIDATGEKGAFSGRVWFQERTGTKAIRKVGFRFGAVTKSGGSGLTVSLQDVSVSAGPPMQPDETQDQTVAIANGDANFAANTWYTTGNLSADRTVAFGELLSIVVEFDGSGRISPDSVGFSMAESTSTVVLSNFSVIAAKLGGTWVLGQGVPNVILEFTDGTFGTLIGSFPTSAFSFVSYGSTSTPDEYALEFSVNTPRVIAGGGGFLFVPSGADFDAVLYQGTTALATVSCDANTLAQASTGRPFHLSFPKVDLAVDTLYYWAIKPTTATTLSLYHYDVASAGHFNTHLGGDSWAIVSRTDGGAWSAPTTTRRPFLWPVFSGSDDGRGRGEAGYLMGVM